MRRKKKRRKIVLVFVKHMQVNVSPRFLPKALEKSIKVECWRTGQDRDLWPLKCFWSEGPEPHRSENLLIGQKMFDREALKSRLKQGMHITASVSIWCMSLLFKLIQLFENSITEWRELENAYEEMLRFVKSVIKITGFWRSYRTVGPIMNRISDLPFGKMLMPSEDINCISETNISRFLMELLNMSSGGKVTKVKFFTPKEIFTHLNVFFDKYFFVPKNQSTK